MRAHLIQFDIAWENKSANYAKVDAMVAKADPAPGDLVVLPEMFDTGFSFSLDSTADSDGATLAHLKALAQDRRVTVQGARTVRVEATGQAFNRATVIGPDGGVLADYSKVHPFSLGREQERFTGGDRVVTYAWEPLTVCPAVCYDLRFPELFRRGLLMGADAFVLGANWPGSRAHHWRALLIARAIENQAFVLGVNRVGRDPTLAYAGGSIAVGPRGDVLGELGPEEAVLSVEIDPREVRAWREKFPAWRDIKLLT